MGWRVRWAVFGAWVIGGYVCAIDPQPKQLLLFPDCTESHRVLVRRGMPKRAAREQFRAIVRSEIEQAQKDPDAVYTPNSVLAERLGIKEHTVGKWVRADLTPEEATGRMDRIRRKQGEKRSDLSSDGRQNILDRVRAEIEAHRKDPNTRLTSNLELAAEFGFDQGTVGTWLKAGIGASDLEYRRQQSLQQFGARRAEENREGLEAAREKIRQQVVRELEEIELGERDSLSGQRELAAEHGVYQEFVSEALSGLNPETRAKYDTAWKEQSVERRHDIRHSSNRERRAKVMAAVKRELQQHRKDPEFPISTNEQLAKKFGFAAPTTLVRTLRGLPKNDRDYRRAEILKQNGERRNGRPFTPSAPTLLRRERREQMRREMSEQIARRRADPGADLVSGSELAEKYRLKSIDAQEMVAGLSEEDRTFFESERSKISAKARREHNLRPFRAKIDELGQSVQEELAEFRAGRIDQLRSNQALASEFEIHNQTVPLWLAENISEADREFRNQMVRSRITERASKTRRANRGYRFEGIGYDSRSEAGLASILQKYIHGFKAEEGKTVHVRLGRKEADFLLGKTFVEYHPIVLAPPPGEFASAAEYRNYKQKEHALPKEKRAEFRAAEQERLRRAYDEEREATLAKSEYADQGYKLIVTHSMEEVYDRVLRADPAMLNMALPEKEAFLAEFIRFLEAHRQAESEKLE